MVSTEYLKNPLFLEHPEGKCNWWIKMGDDYIQSPISPLEKYAREVHNATLISEVEGVDAVLGFLFDTEEDKLWFLLKYL